MSIKECNAIISIFLPTFAKNLFLADFFSLYCVLCIVYIDLNRYIDYIPSSSLVPYQFPIPLQSMTLETLKGPQMSFQMGFHLSLNHK